MRYQFGDVHKSTGTPQVYLSLGIHVVSGPANLRAGCSGEKSGISVTATLFLDSYHGLRVNPAHDLLVLTYSVHTKQPYFVAFNMRFE